MHWRLILEESGPELKYIKGENNVVADAISRLEKSPNEEMSDPCRGRSEERRVVQKLANNCVSLSA